MVDVLDVDGVQVIVLEGEFDASTGMDLGATIERCFDTGPRVVVDLMAATFLDSTILRGLISGYRHTQLHPAHGFAIAAAPGGFPDRVLKLVDMPAVVPTYPDLTSALTALSAASPSPA